MRILLASDGSKFSDAAVRLLTSQANPRETEVRVLQVVQPPVLSSPPQMAASYAPEMTERMKEETKQAKESVARIAEDLRRAGFKADTLTIEAEARAGILDAATNWHADLIVLGSHGTKGLKRFLLGSVAEFVTRHAPCSVLIVRMPSQG